MASSATSKALVAAAGLIIGTGALTACSSGSTDKPAATSPATPTSTEKAVNPGVNGSFTPGAKPGGGPSAVHGNIVTGG